jgi:hypothetical protein
VPRVGSTLHTRARTLSLPPHLSLSLSLSLSSLKDFSLDKTFTLLHPAHEGGSERTFAPASGPERSLYCLKRGMCSSEIVSLRLSPCPMDRNQLRKKCVKNVRKKKPLT